VLRNRPKIEERVKQWHLFVEKDSSQIIVLFSWREGKQLL
jgi:hypothetical protein